MSLYKPVLVNDVGLTETVSLDCTKVKVKVKLRTLDIATLRETPPQKRSGMARVLRGIS